MTDEKKPLEVVFAPGCFDEFEGTQEELDEMIAEITEMFRNGMPEGAVVIPLEDLTEEEAEELLAYMPDDSTPRQLQ